MKVYLVVVVDGYGAEFLTKKCFANKYDAIHYCHENNKDTYYYLQSCADNYERPGNYELLEIREIEVEE